MEKKNKKRLIFNIILVILIIVFTIVAIVLFTKNVKRQKDYEEKNVELKSVGYNSQVTHVGYPKADGVASAFVNAFNNNSGEDLASMMNLPALYVFGYLMDELKNQGVSEQDLRQETINHFDDKYVEVMKDPHDFEDFILMQYEMESYEKNIINGMPAVPPQITLLNTPEIKDITKYLSTLTLELHVVDSSTNTDQNDTMELLLLHRDNSYYLMEYRLMESVKN